MPDGANAIVPRAIRILKVSRTVTDLADITPDHVSEAIQYRTFDRTLWV